MAATFELPPVSTRDILLGSGPRFARDAMGPMLAFYAGWKLGGLAVGIVLSTVLAVAASVWERRHERTGLMARIGLGLAVLQAAVGLLSRSEIVYLAQPVLISGLYGVAFVVSAAIGRPLAGAMAGEMFPFPDDVRSSATFRRVFGVESLVWGAYLLGRSVLRLAMLSGSVEAFLVINAVTGVPFTAALMGWSVWYGVRGFRRSEEWGPVIALLEAEGSVLDDVAAEPTAGGGPGLAVEGAVGA
jgi:intracellular septation protein A